MTVEILLMRQIEGLGIEGDIVKVAAGYARNYLFPKGYAAKVTEGHKRQVEKSRIERLTQIEIEKVAAEELAKKIAEVECIIEVKVGKTGKMFGSVGIPQMADRLAAAGIEIDRSKFKLSAPLHELGEFDLAIKLHPEVDASLNVRIIEEK